ncbi:amidohydrolase family protein [Streptomyces sp. NA04227]|uniref:amidohydrolase family protein n=1 Tax=Streptomyces sp. NA04227 TaxID=2742136 RepID=UPI0015920492|nr:amidohydrolase family protein [Streptomyces sp. NA04227]QKW07110.1 amidohydrolase family protein [Streptomyces sp. NA04227]
MRKTGKKVAIAGTSWLAAAFVLWPSAGSAVPDENCFDRRTQPYTSVVDGHLHFRPFGGEAVPFKEMVSYLKKSGVRHATVFGIGQRLPVDSPCTYYLDCPGTPVLPSLKNDFANAESVVEFKPKDVDLALSMTFPDLAHPESVPAGMRSLDKEYPGMFRWMGEVNLIKQAILPNRHEPADSEDIRRWAPFMRELRERGFPLTIHSDLGSNENPTRYLHLMREVLKLYPDNKIVWAHMGLSKELTAMDPDEHIGILKELLAEYPRLTLDLSWRVLEDEYFSKPGVRAKYAAFLDAHPTRAIPGTDFVASRKKSYEVYEEELRVTSRINRELGDEAFRDIALGQNYFNLLGNGKSAPEICKV